MRNLTRFRQSRRGLSMLASLGVLTNLLVGLLPAGAAHATVCPGAGLPHLSGSFVQPWLVDELTTSQLNSEFTVLNNACISQQILQWTADTGDVGAGHASGTTVYPTRRSGYSQNTSTDVVGRTLSAADSHNVKEFIGLQVNDDWWTNYANNATWLNNEAAKADALADELYGKYGSHRSFGGWYLSFEVDNFNLTTQTAWNNIAGFYRTVGNHLKSLNSSLPVTISPFFNTSGGLDTARWTTMWKSILTGAPIDVIAPQDGIGAGHATNEQLASWFQATKNAISATRPSTQLWANSETFTTESDPLPISSLVSDMKVVKPFVSNYWSFSYDHYDSPNQVDPSIDGAYRAYLVNGS